MPRLKLKELDSYTFAMEIQVRLTDLNYGGHLGNDRFLSLAHEARGAFLKHFGFSETDCGGVSLTMGDAALVFRAESFAGDILRFEMAAGEFSRSGFRLFYRTTRISDRKLIALVETGMVAYDYKKRKVASLPEEVKNKLMMAKNNYQ